MTTTNCTTLWTQPKGTDRQERTPLGNWSDAAADLSGISIHGVTDIKRTTRTIGGDKWTTITIHTNDGKSVDIDCYRAEA